MRKQILLNIAIIELLLFVTKTELFAQFTITGELRSRAEFRNRFKKLRDKGTDPAFFIEQRSRLYVDFKKDKNWLNIALQDVRMWGSMDQVYKTDPTLQNVYEAWARYAFNERYAFKIGRQAMDYDNARFFGNLDWAQQGRVTTHCYSPKKMRIGTANSNLLLLSISKLILSLGNFQEQNILG